MKKVCLGYICLLSENSRTTVITNDMQWFSANISQITKPTVLQLCKSYCYGNSEIWVESVFEPTCAHCRVRITKYYWISFRKPTSKDWVSETLWGSPNGSSKSKHWFLQGVQSETLVQKLGFRQCFWVSRKPGNSVISHPVKMSNNRLILTIFFLFYLFL